MNEPGLQCSSSMRDEANSSRGWRIALPALVATLLAILVIYRETALEMVGIWARSETFTHCFLVPLITLGLIWRLRNNLSRLTPCPHIWVGLLLAATGFVWLLAELASVGVVAQFSLITMLVLAVPAVLGWQVARCIAFPLAFLYFSVPFGEFALPQLMEWTARFTVLGLRLSGIPVYREGLRFIIPSGNWSVIEACSGVRYLIASLCVGTLFAYLNYHSLRRRLIFIAVSFVVPVIANWMRAYMIVMLGHLSGNKLAVGVDHLIYGWVFFGIVITAMFSIGARWREDPLPSEQMISTVTSDAVIAASAMPASFAVIFLVAIWPLAQWQIDRTVAPQVQQLEAFGLIAGWPASAGALSDWSPRFENATVARQFTFGVRERRAGLYVGYYRNQSYLHKMVSSGNVLVTSGDPVWAKVAAGSHQITVDRQVITVQTAELNSADISRLIVWQWYWVNGHLTASDFMAKVYMAFARLMGQGDDSAVIIAYAPKESAGGGESVLASFVNAALPEIESVLRRTRGQR